MPFGKLFEPGPFWQQQEDQFKPVVAGAWCRFTATGSLEQAPCSSPILVLLLPVLVIVIVVCAAGAIK